MADYRLLKCSIKNNRVEYVRTSLIFSWGLVSSTTNSKTIILLIFAFPERLRRQCLKGAKHICVRCQDQEYGSPIAANLSTYSKLNIFFQSFFILMRYQPRSFAAALALSSLPNAVFLSYAYSRFSSS